MPRVLRTAASFAIVLVLYSAYRLIAVPLIEPRSDLRRSQARVQYDRELLRGNHRVDALRGLFPPGSWQLNQPKILESERFKLLMQDYRNLGDGRMELNPCTIILLPDESGDDTAAYKRRMVILDVPDGALLEFDREIDLRQMKIGRLVGGELRGRITIRSQGKSPGPEDDLQIVTRDVQLTEKHVWTPHPVDFHWGPHYGRGRQMHITLLPGKKGKGDRRGPNVGGIETFEMRHVDRLHLELENPETVAKSEPDGQSLPARNPAGRQSTIPVEVVCRGPFRFNVVERVARFEDQVDVLWVHADGPSDQLNCELLSIFFTEGSPEEPGGEQRTARGLSRFSRRENGTVPLANHNDEQPDDEKQKPESMDLQAERIEATGDPVVVSAPSRKLHARGQRLAYNLQSGQIVLDGSRPVMLSQGPNEVHAQSLLYEPDGKTGRLGRIVAPGPGWLRGEMTDRPGEQLEAHWNEGLRVRPQEQNQVISLSGGARLKFREIGSLEAGEIHFWLLESQSPSPDQRSRLRPDRMLARNAVRVDSPQLSAAVEDLRIWFKESRPAIDGHQQDSRTADAAADRPVYPGRKSADRSSSPVAAQPSTGSPQRLPETAQQHFNISGRSLQARVVVGQDRQAQLSELRVEENVRFLETRTKQPDERPLLIGGDRLDVVDADKLHATVTIVGRPAHFEARGLALTGSNINLNRGTNRLWVDGPGEMDLPVDRDMEGQPLRNPGKLKICWHNKMEFDGRTARFDQSVTASGPRQYLETETLDVHFQRQIRFAEAKMDPQGQPEIEQLNCLGGVYMENRGIDPQTREQSSYDRMQAADLAVNRISGAMNAGGPGWITSVRYGSDNPLTVRTDEPDAAEVTYGKPSPAAADVPDGAPGRQLRCLQVHFQGSIKGNLHQRTMTFHDRVRTAYAPVGSWGQRLDLNAPDTFDPGSVMLYCDRLTATRMTTPLENRQATELEAGGNVVVEGNAEEGNFTARAARMTFAEAKGLVVLEGDGRTPAKLYRQQTAGGPTSEVAARKILYWPQTRRLRLDGAQSLYH